jgi:hypothetical protein
VPGDKLIALAGIAEQFQRIWGTRYLAGLWENTLLSDLLWFKNYQERLPRPEKYQCPSWSWAAVDGRVIAENIDDRLNTRLHNLEECEILECETTLASEIVPFGAVTAGTLKVNAALIMKNVTWNPEVEMPSLFVQNGGGGSGSDGEKVCVGYAYPDSADEVPKEVCVLSILWNRESAYAAGLIVVPAEDGQKSCVRRVGYFRSSEEAKDLAWFEDTPRQIISIV